MNEKEDETGFEILFNGIMQLEDEARQQRKSSMMLELSIILLAFTVGILQRKVLKLEKTNESTMSLLSERDA